MKRPLRLLSIGHSYVIALNRRLAHEMARQGGDKWEVTAVAPKFMRGDLRPVELERSPNESCHLEAVNLYGSRFAHVMFYGSRLRKLLRGAWDLVHAWEEPYVFCGAQTAAWTSARVPWVFWTAQNLSKKYPPPFSWLERYCLRRCAGWLACGQTVKETLLPRGYDSKPCRIMPLGVDTNIFTPGTRGKRMELGWTDGGPPVVGFLGRFVPEKGIKLLIEILDQTSTAWRALFVGGGPMEPDLRDWALRYPDRVRIVTGVSHEQVPAYLNAMDMLCAPSQTTAKWREQFGRMLVEAFACAVPVIGSDSGEIPHVVADAGLIAGENDREAWGRAISELLGNPPKRRELGARGRERVLAHYAWPVVAKRHLEFFEELI